MTLKVEDKEPGWLVIKRKTHEGVEIAQCIEVMIAGVIGGQVKLAIRCAKDIPITRIDSKADKIRDL